LWKCVSQEGIESYLFGTMHVRDKNAFGGLGFIQTKIQECEFYYSEMDLNNISDPEFVRFQIMPEGQTLRDLIPEKKYLKLEKSILRSFGFYIRPFDHFYPMILANMIQMSILDHHSDLILDYHLYQWAEKKGKELRYLESAKQQIDLFKSIPLDIQIKSILQLGRMPNKAKKQLTTMLEDYANRNTRQLYLRSKRQLGKLRHKLLYERNEKMADKLRHELCNSSSFVAVGAAHLFGYKGLIRLMKKSGYTVRPHMIEDEY